MKIRQKSKGLAGLPILLVSGGLLLLGLLSLIVVQRVKQPSVSAQRPRRATATTATPKTINVAAKGNLQKALNEAQPGDTLVLEAGASFVGPFTLPDKGPGDAFITIQSSRAAELREGVRVDPGKASLMPKLLSPGRGAPALRTAPRAHHYRLLGIEIGLATPDALVYDLVLLGDGGMGQNSLDQVPHHLVIDRCYIHGNSTMDLKRGIALNSAHTEILNSYISDFHVKGQEAQAVAGWNGPGPFKIINNYLEGAGTNLFFGGAVGGLSAAGMVPADIEIRRNHLRKPMEWRGRWTVKNLFELKSARRVVVDGNVLENNWVDAQSGQAILLTPRPNDSGPAAAVEDVEFTNNLLRNVAGAFSILGKDYLYHADPTSVRLRRVRIANNLITGIDGPGLGGGYGAFILISDGTDSVTVEHNTVWPARSIILTNGAAHTNFVLRHNIVPHGEYGIKGDGLNGGVETLGRDFPAALVRDNALVGVGPPPYGPWYEPAVKYPGNFYPQTLGDVGFMDAAAGNYRLREGSKYRRAGAGEKGLGCDFAQLAAALGGAIPAPLPISQLTPAAKYDGYHDVAGCDMIAGWAWDSNRPREPVKVDIYADGNLIGTVAANEFRQDLLGTGIGDGRHSFRLRTPAALRNGRSHTMSVRFAGTAVELNTTHQPLTCPNA